MSKHTEKKLLKTYQMDRRGNLRPTMLMNELQAVADTHADILGFGRKMCIEKNVAWVLTHFLIDIIEMPGDSEIVEISTWPSVHDAIRAARDYEIRGADGRLMVRATSQWILIDTTARRPVRLAEYTGDFMASGIRAYDRIFDKIPDFAPTKTLDFRCRYDDIDMNQHINNAVYAVWATESVGFEFRDTHRLRKIDIVFKKEIAPDVARIEVDVAIDGLVSRHKIRSHDTEHASVVCEWE